MNYGKINLTGDADGIVRTTYQCLDDRFAFKVAPISIPRRIESMITDEQLQNWFTYHAPVEDQPAKYQKLREAGLHLARTIVELTPPSADQTDAIRSLRNAIMTANAAIACNGK